MLTIIIVTTCIILFSRHSGAVKRYSHLQHLQSPPPPHHHSVCKAIDRLDNRQSNIRSIALQNPITIPPLYFLLLGQAPTRLACPPFQSSSRPCLPISAPPNEESTVHCSPLHGAHYCSHVTSPATEPLFRSRFNAPLESCQR